jgi:non-canonical purine NTP pyrophosphatase (RdgB/HAM1 family)
MEFYFVTSNKNKLREAQKILNRRLKAINLEIPEMQAVDVVDVVQDKAKRAYEKVKKPLIVEDTGLYIKAWRGFPGALIKWLLWHRGNDGICKMLENEADKSAYAQAAICLYDGKRYKNFIGRVDGSIVLRPRGKSDFGWDPIFKPNGHNKTFAEMSGKEKDSISHRDRAFRKLKKYLDANRS